MAHQHRHHRRRKKISIGSEIKSDGGSINNGIETSSQHRHHERNIENISWRMWRHRWRKRGEISGGEENNGGKAMAWPKENNRAKMKISSIDNGSIENKRSKAKESIGEAMKMSASSWRRLPIRKEEASINGGGGINHHRHQKISASAK